MATIGSQSKVKIHKIKNHYLSITYTAWQRMATSKSERLTNYSVRLPDETLQLLSERAVREGVKPGELARLLLSEALGASVRTENSIRLAVETLQNDLKSVMDSFESSESKMLSILAMILLTRIKSERIADNAVEDFIRQIIFESQDLGDALKVAFRPKEH